MSRTKIEVFLGDVVEDPNEQHVLERLRTELAGQGLAARIYANFYTARRGRQRQIDFLIVTDHRTCLVELKCLSLDPPPGFTRNRS